MQPEHTLLLSLFESSGYRAFTAELDRHDVDWERLIVLALEHGVAERLCEAVVSVGEGCVSADIVAGAHVFLDDRRNLNRRLVEAFQGIFTTLEGHGISTIAFKGPALASSAYGDPLARHFRDLDFLVKREDFSRCLAVLAELGYVDDATLSPRQYREFCDYNGEVLLFGPAGAIEPHWAFAPRTLAIEFDYDDLWLRSRMVDILGCEIRVLCPEDELLAICVHGCKERWVKLKWITDVSAFLARHDSLDWDEMVKRSARMGVARMLRIGLMLAAQLARGRSPLPEHLRCWLDRDLVARELALEAMGGLAAQHAPASVFDLNAFHWRMRERVWDRMNYAWRTITQPQSRHFEAMDIPDVFFPLYIPLKVVHDYFALPAWLMLKRLRRGVGRFHESR